MVAKELARTKGKRRTKREQAAWLEYLSDYRIRLTHYPTLTYCHDEGSKGHLWSVHLEDVHNDAIENLVYGSLDDRDAESLAQQAVKWLDDYIAMLKSIRTNLAAAIKRGDA